MINLPFNPKPFFALYQEEGRVYHDIQHIKDILGLIAHAKIDRHSKMLLSAVAWFHDAYYDPRLGSPGNEEKSLEIARGFAHYFSKDDFSFIEKCILATANHLDDQSDKEPLIQLFLDIDMHSFTRPLKECEKYSHKVFNEYLAAGYKHQEVARGQAAFASKLLSKKHIYYTDGFKKLEARARYNLLCLSKGMFSPVKIINKTHHSSSRK